MSLGFALFLGVLAAALNWIWISGLARPDEFVATRHAVAAGDELTADSLIAVPVPGDAEQLRKSLIPFEHRAILYGTKASRDYSTGDVVFQRDMLEPEETSEWEVIGPFQLISVGERFKRTTPDDAPEYSRTDGNTLTIAVDANFDARTRRLLDVISSRRDGGRSAAGILEVQILAPGADAGGTLTAQPRDVVYQTVSLEGIANVPRVLLEGDMIRFVVPARPGY